MALKSSLAQQCHPSSIIYPPPQATSMSSRDCSPSSKTNRRESVMHSFVITEQSPHRRQKEGQGQQRRLQPRNAQTKDTQNHISGKMWGPKLFDVGHVATVPGFSDVYIKCDNAALSASSETSQHNLLRMIFQNVA